MSQLTLARAKEILPKYTTEPSLFKHAIAVSACMEGMADLFHEDKDHWAAIGYLHDVDYQKYPEEHCHHVHELLDPEGVDNADVEAIISHGWGVCNVEREPETNMEKSLITVDGLSGIIMAYALMRPEGMTGMKLKGLKKKFKDKSFAEGVDRQCIKDGIARLGLDMGVIMQACIDGMTAHRDELGI
jgi:predicted hydrolase (HD superfamily)